MSTRSRPKQIAATQGLRHPSARATTAVLSGQVQEAQRLAIQRGSKGGQFHLGTTGRKVYVKGR